MNIDPSDIKLSPDQQAYIARVAQQAGAPWHEVLESLVPGATSEPNGHAQMSAYDLALKLGFVAMSDAGPPDLATNPIHMQGFGQDAFDPSAS